MCVCVLGSALDEEVTKEVTMFKQCLVKMFAQQKREPLFLETVRSIKRNRHTVIECIPLPIADAEVAPMYFKKVGWVGSTFLSSLSLSRVYTCVCVCVCVTVRVYVNARVKVSE
jgi:Protein similar to CwfJ C-terminus 1